jgi:hypothetical protein
LDRACRAVEVSASRRAAEHGQKDEATAAKSESGKKKPQTGRGFSADERLDDSEPIPK